MIHIMMSVLVTGNLLIASGCEQAEKASPPSVHPVVQGKTVEVKEMEFPLRVEATGIVAAKTKATLASKIQGIVEEVRVREGEIVEQHQVLVVLEGRDLKAELARAQAELDNAAIQFARMKRLHAENSVAQQEFDNAKRNFKVATARKEATLARLSYTKIKAPFRGLVTERLIEPGEFTSPGQPLLKLEDPSSMQLEVTVPESDVQVLRQGMTLSVIIDALARTGTDTHLSGTVAKIVPTGDPATHTFLVKVALPTLPGLRSGMFGRALFEREHVKTLVIPHDSLVSRHELTGVFVLGLDGFLHLRWIKTGRSFDSIVEVLSGLTQGEQVLAVGSQGVEGARVVEELSK